MPKYLLPARYARFESGVYNRYEAGTVVDMTTDEAEKRFPGLQPNDYSDPIPLNGDVVSAEPSVPVVPATVGDSIDPAEFDKAVSNSASKRHR